MKLGSGTSRIVFTVFACALLTDCASAGECPPASQRLSAAGESCRRTADCVEGTSCVDLRCVGHACDRLPELCSTLPVGEDSCRASVQQVRAFGEQACRVYAERIAQALADLEPSPGGPCDKIVDLCHTLKNSKDMCLAAAEATSKGGDDACRAFEKGFVKARAAWGSQPTHCERIVELCETLKGGKALCLEAAAVAAKAGDDACEAFERAFADAREAWESVPE